MRLRQKLSDITGAVTGIFGRKAEKDPAVARLDALKVLPIALTGRHHIMCSVHLAHCNLSGFRVQGLYGIVPMACLNHMPSR